MTSSPTPKFIRVEGKLYRLAGKDVSSDEVKESINKAADKAAIENIAKNFISHCGDIQNVAAHLVENLDDKTAAKEDIDLLGKHIDIIVKFLEQLPTTYSRYSSKHPAKK